MPSNPTSPRDPDATSAPGLAATASPGPSDLGASGANAPGAGASDANASGAGASSADTSSVDTSGAVASDAPAPKPRAVRKQVLLRLDPAVHDAVARWADDELRSVNAQIEVILREALKRAGRAPRDAAPLPRRGRPPSA